MFDGKGHLSQVSVRKQTHIFQYDEGRKVFFFEKKNQKTFMSLGAEMERPRQQTKVFCFFFSKKKAFLSSKSAPP
jgi:hypothetical protein